MFEDWQERSTLQSPQLARPKPKWFAHVFLFFLSLPLQLPIKPFSFKHPLGHLAVSLGNVRNEELMLNSSVLEPVGQEG